MLTYSFCIVFCLISVLGMGQTFQYESTTENITDTLKVSFTDADNYRVLKFWEHEKLSEHYFNNQGGTERWIYKGGSTSIIAHREGEKIKIKGTFEGEQEEKTLSIDEDVWINKIDHGLSYFAKSGNEELTFWTVKLSDLEPVQFKAYNEGKETISLNGNEIETIKVKITLKSMLLSKLWSASLWYRTSDGLFIKYEGATGAPGSPITVIELKENV